MTVTKITVPAIPTHQKFFRRGDDNSTDLKAVCIFVSAGFFLGEDTYFTNLKAMQPCTEYELDENNEAVASRQTWSWHSSPLQMTLDEATEEFASLFHSISTRLIDSRKVILPLSGGLDSRTQAVVLDDNRNVHAYSYKFQDSFDETKYGKEIARINGFDFNEYTIPEGYLWDRIERLSEINQCYADFTHPRQMAHIEELSSLGEVFFLGHWGDVLFDDMGLPEQLTFGEQLSALRKKIIKQSGAELARDLWEVWGLEGNFDDHIEEKLAMLLKPIDIRDANARIRAFKSMYWAPRWTSANMNVFSAFRPVAVPYYDEEMCRFICTVPEDLLSGRKIQINYIKKYSPELASVSWQDYDPLNLYDFGKFESPGMLPYRAFRKAKNVLYGKVLGKRRVTRNWEIQFCGKENDNRLKERLFGREKFSSFIPEDVTRKFYEKFRSDDQVKYAHSVSMLLTLSEFSRMNHPK